MPTGWPGRSGSDGELMPRPRRALILVVEDDPDLGEAMIGFFNAWQITGDEKYLNLSISNWDFVKDKILDKNNGEWFWGVNAYGWIMRSEDKAGLWKCPYHNSRACIEIIKRIKQASE